MYLAAAGVGNIGIVEDDTVDVSNLHRQLLFGVNDIGQPKGAVARQKLLANNLYVDIEHFNQRIDEGISIGIRDPIQMSLTPALVASERVSD